MSATRCGVVAVVGAPNAGKSTVVNALVGAKVSIVSPKVQTTRTRVTGVGAFGETQVVFLDTPGIFAPRQRLDRAMVNAAWGSTADADLILMVVDAHRGCDDDTAAIAAGLAERRLATALVLNKIDLVSPPVLLGLTAQMNALLPFQATFMVSARTGDGMDDLKRFVVARMPAGPWLFPEDQLSDMPERLLAAEITREQVFLQLHQELPYNTAVETERWQDQSDRSVRIDQTVMVRREGQKKIVIGAKGARIKAIGAAARRELERVLGRRVHLFLDVKVAEDWAERRDYYRLWGLEYEA